VVVLVKSAILTWLRAADTRRAKLAAAVSLWVSRPAASSSCSN
jgi:hypothetical protein